MTNALIAARDAFALAHPEQRAVFDGRDWGFRDIGSGPCLLLIPGTLGRGDIFWQQIEALSDRLRIVAVSYPDRGGIADWADDLFALLDRLGIAQASVLGSSLGGYLAQFMAGTWPERVERLIAANTLHSVAGLAGRMPYALDLMAAPIDDLRAGFGNGLNVWRDTHPDQGDLVALLLQEAGGRILEGELRARLNALKTAPELPPVPPAVPRSRPGPASWRRVQDPAPPAGPRPATARARVRARVRARIRARIRARGDPRRGTPPTAPQSPAQS